MAEFISAESETAGHIDAEKARRDLLFQRGHMRVSTAASPTPWQIEDSRDAPRSRRAVTVFVQDKLTDRLRKRILAASAEAICGRVPACRMGPEPSDDREARRTSSRPQEDGRSPAPQASSALRTTFCSAPASVMRLGSSASWSPFAPLDAVEAVLREETARGLHKVSAPWQRVKHVAIDACEPKHMMDFVGSTHTL